MTDTRTTRKSVSRETETRRKPWAPPSRLDAPPAPEGYVHRWIRVAMRGEEDKMNVHAKLREGWEPVRSDEYPDYEAPVIDDGRYQGVIYKYGKVSAAEKENPDGTLNFKFEYDIVDDVNMDQEYFKEDFFNLIGDILVDIITTESDEEPKLDNN